MSKLQVNVNSFSGVISYNIVTKIPRKSISNNRIIYGMSISRYDSNINFLKYRFTLIKNHLDSIVYFRVYNVFFNSKT